MLGCDRYHGGLHRDHHIVCVVGVVGLGVGVGVAGEVLIGIAMLMRVTEGQDDKAVGSGSHQCTSKHSASTVLALTAGIQGQVVDAGQELVSHVDVQHGGNGEQCYQRNTHVVCTAHDEGHDQQDDQDKLEGHNEPREAEYVLALVVVPTKGATKAWCFSGRCVIWAAVLK